MGAKAFNHSPRGRGANKLKTIAVWEGRDPQDVRPLGFLESLKLPGAIPWAAHVGWQESPGMPERSPLVPKLVIRCRQGEGMCSDHELLCIHIYIQLAPKHIYVIAYIDT